MKYMGSKARFSKEILPIILKDRTSEQWYIEPFAGGMNMICNVDGKRIANDVHAYLIAMWDALVYKKWQPEKIDKNFYNLVRDNKKKYDAHIVGWVGFNCSYSGKYFGGFAGETNTKIGTVRDYQAEAINNVLKQVEKMQGVKFTNKPYCDLQFPPNSIVYCDPPYEGTTKYANEFNHTSFWEWVRAISKQGHTVYVSEYKAPNDFKCVWSKEAKSSLSANGQIGGNKLSIERLFLYCP
jgi:DNA adenine methylase